MWADIPDDWEKAYFGDILAEKSSRERVKADAEYKMLGVRWYGNGPFHRETRKGAEQSAAHLFRVQYGDVIYNKLFAWKGSFGVVEESLSGCFVSNEFPLFSIDLGKANAGFIARILRAPRLADRANIVSTGTTSISRNRLDERDFLRFPLSLPPYVEQLAISEVLQSVDDEIDRTRDLLKSLAAAKFAVMRDLLTCGMRRDAAPLQPLPERWVLGRVAGDVTHIPADWKLVRLTSVAKLESGHTPDRKRPDYWGGDVPWLSLGDTNGLGGLTVSTTTECATQLGIQNSSARVLPVDTVVFSRTATVGKATRLAVPMATSQDFANWVCGPKICPRYLVQVFRHMRREWDRLQEGSTHQTIYMPVFKKLQILLPPKDEQTKIADAGDAFDLRIEAEQNKLVEFANVRAALAQELLSGRLRLPQAMVARFANVAAQPEVAVA